MMEKEFYKAENEKYKEKFTSAKMISYLVNDYCIICQQPAHIHCCSNHNYCSVACRNYDDSKHDRYCPNKIVSLPTEDLPSIDQLGVFGPGVTFRRHSTKIVNVHYEQQIIERISLQETSTTEEELNRPSTSQEMTTELSSDSDQTVTEDEPDHTDSDSPDQAETDEDQAETEEDQAETEEDQAETEEDQAETDEDQAETDEDQAETDEDQAETEEKPNQSSPTSPTLESSTRSIRLSTRCYGSERIQNTHYQQ
ncbi:hypothetical protein TNIN_405461 [Trichonephila inaurata madagascariensis]|uniref:MYND-type domain-containing protein n=1 Tax=Trichonephila inaurata madagascariensis TaxID=2747483 RepID=A0A8X6YRX6_9ARAC|nr:hypothetical protein TNIN_405461 [Trichonephila inaurata madagascariensis]